MRPHALQNSAVPVSTLSSQHQGPADAAYSPNRQEAATLSAMNARYPATFQSDNLRSQRPDGTMDLTLSMAHGEPSLAGVFSSNQDGRPRQKRERSPGHVDQHAVKACKLMGSNEIHNRTGMESDQEHGCFASALSEAVKKARNQRAFSEEEAARAAVEANASHDSLQDEVVQTESDEETARKEEAELAANIAAAEGAEQHLQAVPSIRPKPDDDNDAERLVRMTLSYADRLLKAAAKDLEDERREKMEAEARKSQEAELERENQLSGEKQSIAGEKTMEEKLAKERLADEAAKAAELAREAKAKKLAADEEIRRCHLQKHRELMAERKMKKGAKELIAERKMKKEAKEIHRKQPSEGTPGEASSSASSAEAAKTPSRPASAAASEAAREAQRAKQAADAQRKTELDRLAALWKVRQQQIVDSRR